MAFGNGDLILIEDTAIASPVIMEIVCNRTGEHNRRWLWPDHRFQRHFTHSDFRHVELTLERAKRRIGNIGETENPALDFLAACLTDRE